MDSILRQLSDEAIKIGFIAMALRQKARRKIKLLAPNVL